MRAVLDLALTEARLGVPVAQRLGGVHGKLPASEYRARLVAVHLAESWPIEGEHPDAAAGWWRAAIDAARGGAAGGGRARTSPTSSPSWTVVPAGFARDGTRRGPGCTARCGGDGCVGRRLSRAGAPPVAHRAGPVPRAARGRARALAAGPGPVGGEVRAARRAARARREDDRLGGVLWRVVPEAFTARARDDGMVAAVAELAAASMPRDDDDEGGGDGARAWLLGELVSQDPDAWAATRPR